MAQARSPRAINQQEKKKFLNLQFTYQEKEMINKIFIISLRLRMKGCINKRTFYPPVAKEKRRKIEE